MKNATKSFTAKLICCSGAVFLLSLTLRWGGSGVVAPYDDAYHLKRIAWVAEGGGEAKRRDLPLPPGEAISRRADSRAATVSGAQPAAITHGLVSLDFDADRGVNGAFCPWPPLYDLAMGAMARATGIESVVWIPPLFFSLFAALLAFSIGRELGLTTAIVAGTGAALSPYLIGVSRVAAIDHHWVEPALVAAIVLAVLRRSATGLALAMTAALFVQTALIVACGIAAIAIVWMAADRQSLRSGAISFALAATAIAIYAATRPAAYPAGPWFLGWTHATLLGAAAVTCAVAFMATRKAAAEKPSLAPRAIATAIGALLLIPLAPTVASGAHFFAGDPWLRSIVEFQPMFRDSSRIGTDLANLGGGVIALIVAMAANRAVLVGEQIADGRSQIAGRSRPPSESPRGSETPAICDLPSAICLATDAQESASERSAQAVIAIFAIAYLFLAITSRRFLVPGIVLFVIAGAVAAASRNRRIAVAAIALTIVPPLTYDVYAVAHHERSNADPVIALANEVASLAPGRVLAPWHAGHAIDVYGRHAVVIDNFGSMPDAPLFAGANAALLETDPGRLLAWCRSRNIRYLALPNPAQHLPAAAACSGRDPQLYARTPLATRTVWWRLWRGDAVAGFARVAPHVWRIRAEG